MANIRSRLKFENKLVEFLQYQGYCCLRSAGSRGPIDVIAFNDSHVRAIQLKTTKALKGTFGKDYSLRYMCADAIGELQDVPLPPNFTRELWVKPLRRNWLYVVIDDLPTGRSELMDVLKRIIWTEA